MDRAEHLDRGPGLERCGDCGRPGVIAVGLLEIVDEGLYRVALECQDCGRLAVDVCEDAELERLERLSPRPRAHVEQAQDF